MDPALKEAFLSRWTRYFPGADLPIVFFYAECPDPATRVAPPDRDACFLVTKSWARVQARMSGSNEA